MRTSEDPHATEEEPLSDLSDEELGKRVRSTPTFRLAVACEHFGQSVTELRESQPELFDRLVDEAVDGQSRVSTKKSAEAVIDAFLDAIEDYADLGESPEEAAEVAAEELAEESAGGA